ncbi:MAG: RHS repeat protein [Niabella sp.]|nr:RHS repeat protein [Niabella sp.]
MCIKLILKRWICLQLVCIAIVVHGQRNPLDNMHPITPSPYQILKYNAFPQGSYTGLPKIDLPLFTIAEDGFSLPVSLNYHAMGNKVADEASWIGLGWNLNFGSIVQVVNDEDDIGNDPSTNQPYLKRKPDYDASIMAHVMPYKLEFDGNCYYNCDNALLAINPVQEKYGFLISPDGYAQVDGHYNKESNMLYSEFSDVDSEPDVFTANFGNYTLRFVRTYNSLGYYDIKLLNETGFGISQISTGWLITAPSGEQYRFEQVAESYSKGYTDDASANNISSGVSKLSSRTWYLTSVTTKNKRVVQLNYNKTVGVSAPLTWTQKGVVAVPGSTGGQIADGARVTGYPTGPVAGTALTTFQSYAVNTEDKCFISSITFSNGQILFHTSPRDDLDGDRKLDSVHIQNRLDGNFRTIKSIILYHSYFGSAAVATSNCYSPTGPAPAPSDQQKKRLRLDSVIVNSDRYILSYNNTLLPPKNSFARDVWGYYNGATSNTSIVPNPVYFNKTDFGTNSNDVSARLQYARAGVLEMIQFPTGGKRSFEYGLNSFDNYWIPDSTSNANTTTSGNGLRIQSIINDDGINKYKKVYGYEGGKSMNPVNVFREYSFVQWTLSGSVYTTTYSIKETSGSGYFSPAQLGGGSGVGYTKVVESQVDFYNSTNNLGRIENYYYNFPDTVSATGYFFQNTGATIPAVRNLNPAAVENGMPYLTITYDKQGACKSKSEMFYSNLKRYLDYGVRMIRLANTTYFKNESGQINQYVKANTFMCFYPLFDYKTLLDRQINTIYENGDSIKSTINYVYSTFGNNSMSVIRGIGTSTNGKKDSTIYYYSSNMNGSQIENIKKEMMSYDAYAGNNVMTQVARYNFSDNVNGLFLPVSISNSSNRYGQEAVVDNISFKSYDRFGNPIEIEGSDGIKKCFLWGYNAQYAVAEIIGTSYDAIRSVVDTSVIYNGTETQVKNELAKLRNYYSSNSKVRITTYTHVPLIGVTTVTDYRGKTVYYEYDSLNRLSVVKDDSGNVLRKICYNYAGQSVDCN